MLAIWWNQFNSYFLSFQIFCNFSTDEFVVKASANEGREDVAVIDEGFNCCQQGRGQIFESIYKFLPG